MNDYYYSPYKKMDYLPSNIRNEYSTAYAKCYRYLRRLFKFQQMDFEFAAWQMVYLFISPQKVFRNFLYRKHVKSQFARDDPAFVVLLCFWLCVTSVGFGIVLSLGFFQLIWFLLYTVFIDTIAAGMIVATILWVLTNHYLVKPTCRDQDVEWGYAFDVHLNAYVPPLLILHFVQLFFYYALPILRGTRVFLYGLPIIVVFFIVSLLAHWNLCSLLINFYKYRLF